MMFLPYGLKLLLALSGLWVLCHPVREKTICHCKTLEAELQGRQSGLCIRIYYLLASKSSHALFSFDTFFTLWNTS